MRIQPFDEAVTNAGARIGAGRGAVQITDRNRAEEEFSEFLRLGLQTIVTPTTKQTLRRMAAGGQTFSPFLINSLMESKQNREDGLIKEKKADGGLK